MQINHNKIKAADEYIKSIYPYEEYNTVWVNINNELNNDIEKVVIRVIPFNIVITTDTVINSIYITQLEDLTYELIYNDFFNKENMDTLKLMLNTPDDIE